MQEMVRRLVFLALAVFQFLALWNAMPGACSGECSTGSETELPTGTRAQWDISKAWRETTATRERICINGLWRWRPAGDTVEAQVPQGDWGFFKVPGCWPGITSYMQKDTQTVHVHPKWSGARLSGVNAAWYERAISIPVEWKGRRVWLAAEYVNSLASVYIDGKSVGQIRFPAGEVDLTNACEPGSRHALSMLVVALPLKGVMLSYTDSASARQVKGAVERRGLCGDVFLVCAPVRDRIVNARIHTSVRKGEITVTASLEDIVDGESRSLVARIAGNGNDSFEFATAPFEANDLRDGKIEFRTKWRPTKLWDIHTPQNMHTLRLSLAGGDGRILDEFPPIRFGFREFWIEGRDFYLNGTPIHLSAIPFDNAQVSAAAATYGGARESMQRLRTFGINFVYTHNYDCEPGSHLSFEETLRAADDVGMLVALTQPHFSHYDWSSADADRTNGYAQHAAFYARVAGNHPSVVAYSTSHNATGYAEDMNPDKIDGLDQSRDQWSANNARKALRAEAIIRALDPGRIVYHHASGNLGAMHTSNFYPNFAPEQELSDWFEHWATSGVKPVFLCEYGAPFSWDWAMYRGWYKGKREFGSAPVPWEFCLAEWNAQFFGDSAFAISAVEKKNLRWESAQFRAGKVWHRWDYPHQLGSTDFPERDPILASYYENNWRAHRTWGLSANSPWEHHMLYRLRPGMDRNRRVALPVDWDNLQRPGFSPDYLADRYERMDLAYERSDWVPTAGGEAVIRNNRQLLAWIGGKPGSFTSKDHIFVPGETVEKQIIVINDSRETVGCTCAWSIALPDKIVGQANVTVPTGRQARVPVRVTVPENLARGSYKFTLATRFGTGETQQDEFTIHVLPARESISAAPRIALFDPKGETARLFERLGVSFVRVGADSDLKTYDVLVLGKGALSLDGPAPDLTRVRDGLKALVFEQTPDVLEKRLGFRVAEYGLRTAFPRVPDHPVLAGLTADHLRDWRGQATILPPRLDYRVSQKFNSVPAARWCDIEVPRLWRCGCRGNVASALIEKPACGDFLALVDGGFSLQYSPLLEYRDGKGITLLCQMDVTGRTETEPAAERLVANMIQYIGEWRPAPRRQTLYVGPQTGRTHLQAAGFDAPEYAGGEINPEAVLIVGPSRATELVAFRGHVARFIHSGGRLLAVGLGQAEADALLSFKVTLEEEEHINAFFEPLGRESSLRGVGPADVHCRDPRRIPLVTGGAQRIGDGALASANQVNILFCQLVPWQFEYEKNYGLKRTFRRASCLLTRLACNLGAESKTPLLSRLATPPAANENGRWLEGLYLDKPEDWDDPYRFFRW